MKKCISFYAVDSDDHIAILGGICNGSTYSLPSTTAKTCYAMKLDKIPVFWKFTFK